MVVLGATPVALAGCEGALSTVDPAGPAARHIATLWWVMLAGGTAIFAFVIALLALAFLWRRDGTGGSERVWVFGLGLGFTMSILAALLAYGLFIGEQLLPRQDGAVVSVNAEARRWVWTFTYADAPELETEGELHIPAGRPIDVAITTADVIHSFWVPRLAGKLDAIPGHVNVLRIEADLPGRYPGVSGEFSGEGYAGHDFMVIAHDPEGWQQFLTGTNE